MKRALILLALVLAVSASAQAAQNAIDSASGKDLTLGAGGDMAMTIKSGSEFVGIGTATPRTTLDVNGGVKVADTATTCDTTTAGTIKWNGTTFQGCNGATWMTFGGIASCYVSSTGVCNAGFYATGGTCGQTCHTEGTGGSHYSVCEVPTGSAILTGTTPTGWYCPTSSGNNASVPTASAICCK